MLVVDHRQRQRHTDKNCAGCDITDRQRHRHSEKETAVPVMASQTGRDTDPQRKRQLFPL